MPKQYARFATAPIGAALAAKDGGLTLTTTANGAAGTARSDVAHSAGTRGAEFTFWGDAALVGTIGVIQPADSLNSLLGATANAVGWRLDLGVVAINNVTVASGLPIVGKGEMVGVRVLLDGAPTIEFYRGATLVHSRALAAGGTWHFAAALSTAVAGTLTCAVNSGQWQGVSNALLQGTWQPPAAAVTTVLLADWDWLTAGTDAPAHARYEGGLDGDSFSIFAEMGFWPWSSDPPMQGGGAQLTINDADGLLDALAQQDVSGLPVAIRLGDLDGTPTRRNYVTHSDAAAAVVGVIGSGGVLPPGWTWGSTAGVTREVVAEGTLADGTPYVDLRIYGTNTSGVASYPDLYFMTYTNAPAIIGETWSGSVLMQVIAGSESAGFSATKRRLAVTETASNGSYLTETAENLTAVDNSSLRRAAISRTMSNASLAFARMYISFAVPAAGVIDVTLRIAAPQLEIAPAATDYIKTTGTSLTVNGTATLAGAVPIARFVADRIEVQGDNRKTIYLRDAHDDLDEPLTRGVFLPNVPALAWRVQPVVIGAVASVPALTANSDGSVAWLADAPLMEVATVLDRGDAMEAGTWAVTPDKQQLTLSMPPVGPVVVDASSIGAGMQPATLDQTLREVFRRNGKASWSAADAAAIDAATGYAGIGYYAGDAIPVRQALAAILPSYGAWFWQAADGVLRFTRVVDPASVAPGALVFDLDLEAEGVEPEVIPDDAARLSRRMAYRPNARVLTPSELVTDMVDVPAWRRDELTAPWRGQVYSAKPLASRYVHADTAAPLVSCFWRSQDAQTEIDRVCAIYGTQRQSYVVPLDELSIPVPLPGQVGRISYPRFGLAAGKQVLVRRVTRSPGTGAVNLVLWG